MPVFGTPMPKDVIAKVAANDASLTKVDLSGNATFQMKANEYCTSLARALEQNTYVKELKLDRCNITDVDAIALSGFLSTNSSLEVLSLEGNKIGSDGSVALAMNLKPNETLTDLLLLGQENTKWGETCLEGWLETLENNTTILNIKWRLESRKSFAINKFLTRNKEILRRKKEGRDFSTLLPTAARVSPGEGEDGDAAAPASVPNEEAAAAAPAAATEPPAAVDEPEPSDDVPAAEPPAVAA